MMGLWWVAIEYELFLPTKNYRYNERQYHYIHMCHNVPIFAMLTAIAQYSNKALDLSNQ